MRILLTLTVAALVTTVALSGQTPQPFPRPPATGQGPTTPPARPAPQQPATQPPAAPTRPAAPDQNAPTEATLGLPVYPAAQFIASYDAGRGQRFYIYGSSASFAELVTYYRTYLKERGNFVFEEPPTHMFEVGRFREETMAFPPGVTIKDYTWGGSKGYPNPKRPAEPEHFPTIIMIVPAPAAQ
jgi:hypothetical protein